MGELPHEGCAIDPGEPATAVQAAAAGFESSPEIRIRISPTRYRVADLAVWRDDNIGDRIPTVPPFLVIEILSPEDRIMRMQPKIAEYLSIGVEWIWLIDPIEKSAICYACGTPRAFYRSSTD